MLATLKEVLAEAKKGGYAVGAYNITTPLALSPLIKAAENKHSPLIINIAEISFKDCDIQRLSYSIIQAAKDASIPVVINLDHGLTFDAVQLGVRCGFTSMMFDGSKLSHEENIRQTKKVVEIAHPLGISVEGEIGHVGGGEAEAGSPNQADPDLFTKPEEVIKFVEATGVDALAVAIGNVHGFYKGEPELQFELLKEIAAVSPVPLVLHGGSGISDEDFRKAASLGISKINFYTGVSNNVFNNLTAYIDSLNGNYVDMTAIVWNIMNTIQETVENRMDVFGSSGKA